ncbi:hypothetical protein CNMCM5623_008184 [Aspergillus felis]|uniref:NAD-dependent epimerase/dehydratase domain-containing protein n=1 Tax=Aspergillus felis TaxID=1287682 RepID=A0A8H6PJK1_9EURO|nr:hypothetical protein CNMCM5623_008184 [Aspergillus felis]
MPLSDFAIAASLASYAILHPLDFYSSVGPTVNETTFGLLGASFDPKRDITDLSGKVIFVTGGNIGLGKETILQLAHHRPSRIYLGARNATKARDAIADIQKQLSTPADIRHIPLDLASFASIRSAAEKFTSECDRLDVLILNAGTMGNPPTTTEEGFEVQFGTNHIGHFLLTKLLLPVLQKTAASPSSTDVRVVTLSSLANCVAPSYDVMTFTDALLAASTWTRYAASKAANILFASELARRYPEILSVSIHPGAVTSNLYEHAKASDLVTKGGVAALSLFFRSSGQVFSAMSGQFALSEPFPPGLPPTPDAVIHLAGYSRNMLAPDDETFRTNTVSTYNVIEAACKLGIRKIIIASSVTVYGVSFALGDTDYPSFPVDEEVDANPTDTYAIAKVCGERVARGFAGRFGTDIYVFRIGRVIAPEEYEQQLFHSYVCEPAKWKAHGWSYTDARDLGRMCDLGLRKSGLGFQIFNATNDTITNTTPTEEFLKQQCPNVPFTRQMEEFEAPLTNAKIKSVLGFQEEHPWRNYFPFKAEQ